MKPYQQDHTSTSTTSTTSIASTLAPVPAPFYRQSQMFKALLFSVLVASAAAVGRKRYAQQLPPPSLPPTPTALPPPPDLSRILQTQGAAAARYSSCMG